MTSTKCLFRAVVTGFAILAACGRTALNQSAKGGDGGGAIGDTGKAAADAAIRELGFAPDGSPSGVSFSGVVVAKIDQSGTTNAYSALAEFVTGAPFGIVSYSTNGLGVGSCGCQEGTATPGLRAPDAGTVTLMSVETTVATLEPGGTGETWDLGSAWRVQFGAYWLVDSQSWNPGDALTVSATGNQVHAFTGTLQTGSLLAGVVPLIGPAPVVVDLTQDFEVSWTPEGRSNEIVLLMLQGLGLTCYCIVPDSAAHVTVDASIVNAFGNAYYTGYSAPGSGRILLDRLITTSASSDNASIALIGEVAMSGDVTFQ